MPYQLLFISTCLHYSKQPIWGHTQLSTFRTLPVSFAATFMCLKTCYSQTLSYLGVTQDCPDIMWSEFLIS